MSCRRSDVVARDPEHLPERDQWLTTCPHCLSVMIADSPEAALEAWEGHEMAAHPHLPESALWGRALLDALLAPETEEHHWARWAIRDHWTGWGPADGGSGFTGADFDSLGYRNGADPSPNAFTAVDIVAVTMLGIDVPAAGSLQLLEPDDGYGINRTLAEFDDKPLHEATWQELAPGSAPDRLWHLIRSRTTKTGPTTTGKLLSRKRPHLIPVYDSRLAARLLIEPSENYWQWWWQWWQEPGRAEAVSQLQASSTQGAGATANRIRAVSLLRILDVAVWRYDYHYVPHRRGADGDDPTA